MRSVIATIIVLCSVFGSSVRASPGSIVPEPSGPGTVAGCYEIDDMAEIMTSNDPMIAERKINTEKKCILILRNIKIQLGKAIRRLRALDGNPYCLIEAFVPLRDRRFLKVFIAGLITEGQKCGEPEV